MEEFENFTSHEEWEEYFARQKIRNKRILKPIISSNEEFQGEWKDDVTEWLGGEMLYSGNNEDFIKIEVNSERTGILVLILKMLVNECKDKGLGFEDELTNKYLELALAIADIKSLSRKSLNEDDVTELDIKANTQITSNYSKPIETQIVGKKATDSRIPIYLDFIDDALSIYLESEIRHSGIDLLFLTLYADQEIIAYIDTVGKSKYWEDDSPIKDLFRSNISSSLENEEKAKLRAEKTFSNNGFGSYKYIAIWIIASVIVFFIGMFLEVNGIIPESYGIGSLVLMIGFYIVYSFILGRRMQEKLDNFEKYFPTITMIRNMERFYFAIRQKKSRLWLRDVKKELGILTEAGAVMPDGMMKIIEDMEKRRKSFF